MNQVETPNKQRISPLRWQREIRGWSLERVAEELDKLGGGCDSKRIGKWELGKVKPSPFYREKLCLLYGVSADQLGLVDDPGDGQVATFTPMPLEGQQTLEQELGDLMPNRFDPSRRSHLQFLLQVLGAATLYPSTLDPDMWSRLQVATAKPSNIDAQTLTHIEQLNETCWNLNNSNQLDMVAQILPAYLPKVTALALQSSPYQSQAASLASRGYILAAEIDKKNVPAMQAHAHQAIFYSQLTQDYNVQVDALRQEATIALVAKQPLKALAAYQHALPLLSKVTPLLRSRIYLGLASASARCGQKQDALRYLGLAQEHFPANTEKDPNILYMYNSGSRSVLHLYEALTFNDLQQPKNAEKALLKVDGLHPKMPVTESARIEIINLQAKTAASLGNMDESCMLLQASVEASDRAGYAVWRDEAADIFQDLLQLWPHELQVRRLGKLFQRGA